MRIAYLDCFAGVSGDMFLGALIDSGLDPNVLQKASASLKIEAQLRVEKVDRSGITATKVHVLDAHGAPAESSPYAPEQSHTHTHDTLPKIDLDESVSADQECSHPFPEQTVRSELKQQTKTQHQHKDHHHHDPVEAFAGAASGNQAAVPHAHAHGRSHSAICQLIEASDLDAAVKEFSIRTFGLLGAAEARIHNVSIDQIHFHEVGAVDAIVDIVASAAGIHALNAQALAETGVPLQWHCSALNVGGGMVNCAHGRFPVPAPATADLLKGMPTYSADLDNELVTPTGAAIIRALDPRFSRQPVMRVQQIGYGAGTRNPDKFPNVLRLSIGDAQQHIAQPDEALGRPSAPTVEDVRLRSSSEVVTVIETALDDCSPQILAHVTEKALELGALDVMCTAVQMKKGRLGTLVTILANDKDASALETLLLEETSTLGLRIRQERRSCLNRTHVTVKTPYGAVRIKVGSLNGEELNAAPEFDDCRSAAATHKTGVKIVMQAAIAAYVSSKAN